MEILLDKPKAYFGPEETITGKAKYAVPRATFIEVKVRLVGEECTRYVDEMKTGKEKIERCLKTTLLDDMAIAYAGNVEEGDHEFPFSIGLPKCIPSTYLRKFGHVKFFVQVSLSGSRIRKYEDEVEVKVFSPIDVGYRLRMLSPPGTESDKWKTEKWWCIQEEIHMEVHLAKNGFILGEVIRVGLKLKNDSSYPVSQIRVQLIQRVQGVMPSRHRFHDKKFARTSQCLVQSQEYDVRPYKTEVFNVRLKIPKTVEVPNFDRCTIFTHHASLEATAEIQNSSKSKLKVELTVVLGHLTTREQNVSVSSEGGKDGLSSKRSPSNSTSALLFCPKIVNQSVEDICSSLSSLTSPCPTIPYVTPPSLKVPALSILPSETPQIKSVPSVCRRHKHTLYQANDKRSHGLVPLDVPPLPETFTESFTDIRPFIPQDWFPYSGHQTPVYFSTELVNTLSPIENRRTWAFPIYTNPLYLKDDSSDDSFYSKLTSASSLGDNSNSNLPTNMFLSAQFMHQARPLSKSATNSQYSLERRSPQPSDKSRDSSHVPSTCNGFGLTALMANVSPVKSLVNKPSAFRPAPIAVIEELDDAFRTETGTTCLEDAPHLESNLQADTVYSSVSCTAKIEGSNSKGNE